MVRLCRAFIAVVIVGAVLASPAHAIMLTSHNGSTNYTPGTGAVGVDVSFVTGWQFLATEIILFNPPTTGSNYTWSFTGTYEDISEVAAYTVGLRGVNNLTGISWANFLVEVEGDAAPEITGPDEFTIINGTSVFIDFQSPPPGMNLDMNFADPTATAGDQFTVHCTFNVDLPGSTPSFLGGGGQVDVAPGGFAGGPDGDPGTGGYPTDGLGPSDVPLPDTYHIGQIEPIGGNDYLTFKVEYDPPDVIDAGILDEASLKLLVFNEITESWAPAGGPSNTMAGGQFVLGAPTSNYGDYGVDTEMNVVWANIDHASTYAVVGTVPEPATWLLLLTGACCLAIARSRTRRPM